VNVTVWQRAQAVEHELTAWVLVTWTPQVNHRAATTVIGQLAKTVKRTVCSQFTLTLTLSLFNQPKNHLPPCLVAVKVSRRAGHWWLLKPGGLFGMMMITLDYGLTLTLTLTLINLKPYQGPWLTCFGNVAKCYPTLTTSSSSHWFLLQALVSKKISKQV
jgi:hypothetical protein